MVQSNLYISIASGPGGAMLLKWLCIYRGFKYAIIAIQSDLYISIISGPGGAMLLKRLCIYTGFKYATIAIVPKSGQQGQC